MNSNRRERGNVGDQPFLSRFALLIASAAILWVLCDVFANSFAYRRYAWTSVYVLTLHGYAIAWLSSHRLNP